MQITEVKEVEKAINLITLEYSNLMSLYTSRVYISTYVYVVTDGCKKCLFFIQQLCNDSFLS